jgi:hypothetical protein
MVLQLLQQSVHFTRLLGDTKVSKIGGQTFDEGKRVFVDRVIDRVGHHPDHCGDCSTQLAQIKDGRKRGVGSRFDSRSWDG